MEPAQLYWDDQDPKTAGWWLRYYSEDGAECGEPIDGSRDTFDRDLAGQAAVALPVGRHKIKIYGLVGGLRERIS